MICAACQTPNEADARFCEGCGSALERRCAACGTPASATARFCKSCGGSLDGPAQAAPAAPTRKTVTVLFADLAGSTTFEEKVDAETAREVMGQYHSLLAQTADRHRAGVTKYIGDGFMAVWGVPEINASDADHAVDAAVELQERFVDLAARVADTYGEELALRVAVNTGEVVVGAEDADLVGDALNVAARLESQCPHGHVVVGEETWRSTRGRYRYEPLSPVQVKGRAAPVAVYQWAGRRSEPADSIPFVGRFHEMRRLHTVLDESEARQAARLVTVIGDPGVGKTRLASEFARAHREAAVLQIRCAAEGTVALAPVVEVLRTRDLEVDIPAEVPERDRILRDLNGMTGGVAGSVEETFWGLRRYFEVLASTRRLILVLDDIQWADALLFDFIEHLSEWVREAPMLMIALARPELRDSRPELVTVGGWVGDAIRLGGLEPGATAELAARVLGSDKLPPELLARLPSSTGGNPLFVRELVAMLVHDGVLVAEANGWRLTIDADAIAVPPTIQALLASRLERMNTADRRVLETASVIGTDFSPAAVCALSGASPAEVKASLDRLRRLELAQPSGAYSGDEPVWRLHHILIRDVAYRRLLKSDRAELHERFADWVRDGGRAGVFESDELLARHLESAYGYRCELGARDSATAELALQSARCYLSAARRALDRDALVSAGAQAARGAALASADKALHAELLLVGCEAYLSAGDVAAGAPLVDELDRIADAALAPWATCYRCQYIVYTDPSRLPEIDEQLRPAIDEFARRGDPSGSAKAYRVRANARGRLGRIGDAEADLFEALIAARKCGDHRQITAALGAAPAAALWGPSPAPKAGGRCLDVVRMQRMTTAAPSLEATSLRCLAVLELLRGRPDKARSMLAHAREIVAELGLRHGLMETELYAGIIESMAGDPVAAEPHFRTALEGLDSLGVGADAGQAAALLARSLLAQGRVGEADRYAAESERIAGHNLKTAIGWRAVRAEILSVQGRHREAVAMAREAVDVAAETDLVLDYADACLTLSRVLVDSGDRQGATEARRKAESLYAAKDAVFLVGVTAEAPEPVREQKATAPESRLRLTTVNRASDVPLKTWQGTVRTAAGFLYEDRRQFSGGPLEGVLDLHTAAKRKLEQYPHVEAPVLAARGEGLALVRLHWWDDAGNQTTSLDLYEVDEADELVYHGRFDEDDFPGAYRVLEERYYAGEGADFAAGGHTQLRFQEAIWANDVEAARSLVQPDFVWIADPSTLKPGERSLDEMFTWRAERLGQVGSFEDWPVALQWLSPEVCVLRVEMKGEDYRWPRIYVTHFHDGRLASGREFGIADEDEAFAYAESLVVRQRGRLVVGNRASAVADGIITALKAKDGSAAAEFYAEVLVYDDRRQLRGNPVNTREDGRRNAERMVLQYSNFEHEVRAVRGERSALVSSHWSDAAGNETAHLHVFELDDDGLIGYEGRFDEGDFVSAYRVLEERYYAGEGAPFAANGQAQLQLGTAIYALDLEAARPLVQPDFVLNADPSTLKPAERSLEELFRWGAERFAQVASFQMWSAALEWMSPEVCISLLEMRGTGHDGEEYRWPRYGVLHFHDGLLASGREFDIADEDEVFAYAESLLALDNTRLVVRNRASAVADGIIEACRANDSAAAAAFYAEGLTYDDRRSLGGNAVTNRSDYVSSLERLLSQYSRFDSRPLAVRGDRLVLVSTSLSDSAGNESDYLHLFELDEEGLVTYEGRFDEGDFLSAYVELDRRYYAGEGAEFADSGRAAAGWVEGIGRRDVDMVRRFSTPDFRWIAAPSSLKAAERTVEDIFEWLEVRGEQVSSQRHWQSVLHWVSPSSAAALVDVAAVGQDGEQYVWNYIIVSELRDGLVASVREFATEDEAFAYADSVVSKPASRLGITNRASVVGHRLLAAVQAGDLDTATDAYADDLLTEDRRRMSADPVIGGHARRAAFERITQQYSRFELETLAVRGERLHLARHRWSDDSGNESVGLVLQEVGGDGLIVYDGRFDEDDFETAYLEMERRYLAGEGKAHAEAGAALMQVLLAETRGDLDSAFAMFAVPGLRIESRSRSVFPGRSAAELRRSVEELGAMVGSYRVWSPAGYWLSPEWVVARHQREAVGSGDDALSWSRIYVIQIRNGLAQSVCEFDAEDEEQAFAYAEERMRAKPSRLAISNRASEAGARMVDALRVGDVERAVEMFPVSSEYGDYRRISGDPITGRAARREAIQRSLQQFTQFALTTIAVRGENLALARSRRSDDAGNESTVLIVGQIDDDGHVVALLTFDEDDFESAFLELEKRYYAGEGAAFAEAGAVMTDLVTAGNRGDNDKVFELMKPGARVESRSRTIIPSRTLDELRSSIDEFKAMVRSSRTWYAAVHWLSPACAVVRQEREAVGLEGQSYEWSRIYVVEIHDGRFTAGCEFDIEFEDEAFAYAEDLLRASARRLTLQNRASTVGDRVITAVGDGQIDQALSCFADDCAYEDRRQLSGDPIVGNDGRRSAFERVLRQYGRLETKRIAVRGEHLVLEWLRRSDESGNESTALVLGEVNDDDRLTAYISFDEDDFEGAYRELERRYYAGEGAASADSGTKLAELVAAANRGDFESALSLVNNPDLRLETRSRGVFPDRSIAELREDLEDLLSMTSSARWWYSDLRWLSPNMCVGRQEREAIGPEGERYAWTDILVYEFQGDAVTWMCRYNLDDEAQAFADAEARAMLSPSRLAVSNRASEVRLACSSALMSGEVQAAANFYSDVLQYDDRRRISGDVPVGRSGMRAAFSRLTNDYNHFDGRILAVRGDRLALAEYVCSDSSGNRASGLTLTEIGVDGLIHYEGRFDEDDFGSAYAEMERRYYAGEGAAFAVNGMASANYLAAVNRGDFTTAFEEFVSPDLRIESRAHRSGFAVQSAAEYRASFEELQRLVGAFRDWFAAAEWVAPNWAVIRYQRVAVGRDSEDYQWDRICVCEVRNGRLCYICDFDLEDEDAAFAYAEECAQASDTRLPLTNQASELMAANACAMASGDLTHIDRAYREDARIENLRSWAGHGTVLTKVQLLRNVDEILQQFNVYQWQTLAVRGQRLVLGGSTWSDEAGNRSMTIHVVETGDDGRIARHSWFDEDDFDSAYAELERRYYAGEGSAFADSGTALADYVTTKNQADLDTLFKSLSTADLRIESRSASVFVERTAAEYRASVEHLLEILGSTREWFSAITWVSPTWFVGRFEREAGDRTADDVAWDRILVGQIRDGRLAHICMFTLDNEDAAFAYAEERASASAKRLPLTNKASDVALRVTAALSHGDPDAFVAAYREDWSRDDRRRLAGAPIGSPADMRVSVVRMLKQFNNFEWVTLAIRGTKLAMGQSRSSDGDGNVSTYLHVFDVDDDGLITYEARFDEDDFDSAVHELDRRYLAEEGVAYAAIASAQADFLDAVNQADLEAAKKLCLPSFRVISPPTTLAVVERSLGEFIRWVADRIEQLPSVRHWMSTTCWVSTGCMVGRLEIQSIGPDGDGYSWPRIAVTEIYGGRFAHIRQFDIDDEDSAFAYADEIVARHASRLLITNIASGVAEAAARAMTTDDFDLFASCYSDDLIRADHRRLSGDPTPSLSALWDTVERIRKQYSKFELRGLAVRGSHLALGWIRWSDDAGNETATLEVLETGEDGRIIYNARFDEDDFDSAYRELERRYFAGAAAEFAEIDEVQAAFMLALNHVDLDAAKRASLPSLRIVSSPGMLSAEERTLSEFFRWGADRVEQAPSLRHWLSSLVVLSANCVVGRIEVQELGSDRDGYSWPRLMVTEFSGGRFAHIRQFDLDDEDSAFAYADEIVAKHASRLPATNIATEVGATVIRGLRSADFDLIVECYSEDYVNDDRRQVNGDPIRGVAALRDAAERIRNHYSNFEVRVLAVRGSYLTLAWSRWSDDAGNETTNLEVVETGADGRIIYTGRFDEDDFEGAYAEMERRYYAGEGAAFASNGLASANYMATMNRGDFDTMFNELTRTDLHVENYSRSAFPDRSTRDLRASMEQLHAMLSSVCSWFSVVAWVSPTVIVARHEREGFGKDGERYAWSRILVSVWRDGKLTALSEFDADDEAAAFACAQSLE